MMEKKGRDLIHQRGHSMKRNILLTLICIVLAILSSCGSKPSSGTPKEQEEYYLEFEIDYEDTNIFVKYDVIVYVDEEPIGTIHYGNVFHGMIKTTRGSHEIKFVKGSDSSVKTDKTVKVSEDSTYICKLNTSINKISISDAEVKKGLLGETVILSDVHGLPLSEAIRVLHDLGLNNVSYRSKSGDVSDGEGWVVDSMSRPAGSMLTKSDALILECVQNLVAEDAEQSPAEEAPETEETELSSTLETEETSTSDVAVTESEVAESTEMSASPDEELPEETSAEPVSVAETTAQPENREDVLLPFVPYERFSMIQNILIYICSPNTHDLDEIVANVNKVGIYSTVVIPEDENEGFVFEDIREVEFYGTGGRIWVEYWLNDRGDFFPNSVRYKATKEEEYVIRCHPSVEVYYNCGSYCPAYTQDYAHPLKSTRINYPSIEEALDAYIDAYINTDP